MFIGRKLQTTLTGIRPVSLYDFFPITKEQSESSGDIRTNASIQMKDVYFSYKNYKGKSLLAVPEGCFPSGTVIAVIGNNGSRLLPPFSAKRKF